MTLFTGSCHDPNGWFTLFCAGSVFDTQLMPYCVNSTSLVSKSVIRRYNGQFQGQGQLRSISCYFDLMSNFQLDPRSKSICFDTSWRKNHDGACIIPLDFLVLKLFAKNDTPSNRYLSFFDPTWGGSRYDLKRSTRVPLDSEHPKDLFGLRPTVIYLLSTKWHGGCNLPPIPRCILGWGNSMCGRGLCWNGT